MVQNAVELSDVSYQVPQGFFLKSKTIVRDISFFIPKGESMGLIGPNGAGKTTTIKLCTGILTPKTGKAFIDGQPCRLKSARAKLGLLTENQYIPGHLKVNEWLFFLGRLSGMAGQGLKQAVQLNMERFHLDTLADRTILGLSKGQVQRLGFAQAFLHNPAILVLDEPMSGMDPLWRSRLHDILLDYKKQGNSLLFSSHIMSDVLQLSDRITVIKNGTVSWQGTMNDIHRNITRYEAVVHGSDMKIFDHIEGRIQVEAQPDGSHKILADKAAKDRIIELVSGQQLSLASLTPVYPAIEDIFK